MRTLILFASIIFLSGQFGCSSDSDVLVQFQGGQITRGEFRNYLRFAGQPTEGSKLSTKFQTKILKQMALQKLASLELKAAGFDTSDDYKRHMRVSKIYAQRNYLTLHNREQIENGKIDLYQVQILFKRYPKKCYNRYLKDEPKNVPGKASIQPPKGKSTPLLKGPAAGSGKAAALQTGQKVTVLGKAGAITQVGPDKGYYFQVKVDSESAQYHKSKNKKGVSKLPSTQGKTGYVFGGHIRYSIEEKQQEQCKEKFRKNAGKILEEFKSKSGNELDLYVAKETDDRSSQVTAGIQPFLSPLLKKMRGYEHMEMVEGLNEGDYAKEPFELGSGLKFLYVRKKVKESYAELEGLMEDHFSSMTKMAKKVSAEVDGLSKKAERFLKKDPVREAAKFSAKLKKNIQTGAGHALVEKVRSQPGFVYNEDFDLKKPSAVVAKTPEETLTVKDLPQRYKLISGQDNFGELPENQARRIGLTLGELILFKSYFKTAKASFSDKELKDYQAMLAMWKRGRNLGFYLDKAKPSDGFKVKPERIKQAYEKQKKTRWTKKENGIATVVPFAKAEPQIKEGLQKMKQRKAHNKLREEMYKKFDTRINAEALKNGEV